jgi:predicted pyridoxine 5'-phosphate oxidase superfamily flavin-nucleotide-binding protein
MDREAPKTMTDFYSEGHRALQDAFDSRRLADALRDKIMRQALAKMDKRFIEASDMFFLSTLDHNGWPTVSYKGGAPGFVKVLDDRTLAFPSYDGNGMFYSMGNIADRAKVGLLFIDFVNPRRLRLHGTAQVSADDPLMGDYDGAALIVRVALENIFTNCARYIHQYEKVGPSKYLPKADGDAPLPDWKRMEHLQDALPAKDKGAVDKAGGAITEAEYRKDFWRGLE